MSGTISRVGEMAGQQEGAVAAGKAGQARGGEVTTGGTKLAGMTGRIHGRISNEQDAGQAG
jgi:hypothetical protein